MPILIILAISGAIGAWLEYSHRRHLLTNVSKYILLFSAGAFLEAALVAAEVNVNISLILAYPVAGLLTIYLLFMVGAGVGLGGIYLWRKYAQRPGHELSS